MKKISIKMHLEFQYSSVVVVVLKDVNLKPSLKRYTADINSVFSLFEMDFLCIINSESKKKQSLVLTGQLINVSQTIYTLIVFESSTNWKHLIDLKFKFIRELIYISNLHRNNYRP